MGLVGGWEASVYVDGVYCLGVVYILICLFGCFRLIFRLADFIPIHSSLPIQHQSNH